MDAPLSAYRTEHLSPDRDAESALADQARAIAANLAVFERLVRPGRAVAVINERRQIVAANREFRELSSEVAGAVLGFRVGEALRCVHSDETPGGCGTTRFCRNCGIAGATAEAQCWESAEGQAQLTLDEGRRTVGYSVRLRSVLAGGYRLFALMVDPKADRKAPGEEDHDGMGEARRSE
jgi:hypothetical protein